DDKLRTSFTCHCDRGNLHSFPTRRSSDLNTMKNINHTRSSISDDIRNILCSSANMRRAIPLILLLVWLMLLLVWLIFLMSSLMQIGRAVQQECRDRSRMPSSA